MRRLAMPSLCIASFILGGCSTLSGYPNDPFDGNVDLSPLKSTYDTTAIAAYVKETDPSKRLTERNQIVYGRIIAYDIEFGRFERRLAGQIAGFDVSGDFAGLALTGLATAAKNAATKTNLAAAALGVVGAKSAVQQELFYNKALPSVVAQMEANRLKARASIEVGLAEPDAKYPLSEALVDLQAYANAGNITSAVASIAQSAGNQANQSTSEIKAVRSLSYTTTDAAKRMIAWLYPGGDETRPIVAANATRLQAWMTKDTVDTTLASIPMEVFLHGDYAALESDRTRAVIALQIP